MSHSNETQHNQTQHDDLEWSAFRYVADEMSAEEIAAFELRLSEEQSARDVVARTVQMTQSVASLPALIGSTGDGASGSSRRSLLWATSASLIAIAAICAAFAVGLQFTGMKPIDPSADPIAKSPGKNASPAVEGGEQILSAWLDLDAEDFSGTAEEDVSEDTDRPIAGIELGEEAEGEFDWIVAAVDLGAMMGSMPDGPEMEDQ